MSIFFAFISANVFLLLLAWSLLPKKDKVDRPRAVDLLLAFLALSLSLAVVCALFLFSFGFFLTFLLIFLLLLLLPFSLTIFYSERQMTLALREEQRKQFFSLGQRGEKIR